MPEFDCANLWVIECRRTVSLTHTYKRREASIEESLIEMYLAGVSGRRVEETRYISCSKCGAKRYPSIDELYKQAINEQQSARCFC